MFSWKKSSAAEQPVSAPPVSTVALDARMQAAADAVSQMTSPAAAMPPPAAASAAAPGPTLAAMQNIAPKAKASSGAPGSGGEDGAAVVLKQLEPLREVLGMVRAGVLRDAKLGTQERTADFPNLS